MSCSRDISKNVLCSDISGYVVVANYGFLIIELGQNQQWQHWVYTYIIGCLYIGQIRNKMAEDYTYPRLQMIS